jgi:hypothetical protein
LGEGVKTTEDMYYVDYTTNEIVNHLIGFGDREFVEVSREPYTIERWKTIESFEVAAEKERMKLPLHDAIESKECNSGYGSLIIGCVLGFIIGWLLYNCK